MANLNLRKNLTQALSFTQLDGNFEFLEDLNTSLETRVSAEEALSASVDASLETVITDNKTTSDAAEASLDTRLDNFSADFATDIELSEAVSVETARAIAAEGVIEDNLSTELVDRAAADSTLQGNIDGVSTDLSDYEASNDAALSTEVADRASADTQLQNNIDGVAGDLTQEISDREADVDAEETRAIAAEGSIASDLADYETSNDAALSTEVADRIADVDAEETRALAAEGVIADNLSTELVARASADVVLQDNIDAEETRAIAAEGSIASDLSDYETSNDAALSTEVADRIADVDAEQLRAETAEGVIEDNLSTELVDRASADTVLEGKIVTEETARISGDASLATRIDNLNNDFATDIEVSEAVSVETARAIAAEGSIASDLSDYETSNDAALSTELVARASADTVLQGNIDAEETRALAAEGVIEDNLSTELVDRAAADVVLQGNIDAEETRAIAAEGSIASDLSDYETSNDAALSTEVADRIADVDAEETRALAAEGVIADNLSTELVDRAAADNDLSTDITAEETARISGDASLTTRIDNLNNDFATDIEVSEAVSVETARAIAAEGVIEDNLSTELVDRASADVVLQDNIDAVAGDLSDYETSNDAALSTELVVRASADTVLQGNIDDVEYLAENPRYIFDGNKLDITGASYAVVGSAEAIMVVDAPAVTNGNIDFTAATAGTISTIVIADLAGDSTGSSEFIVRFNQLFGNPYGGAELILQEGESAQVYMLSTGVGVLLAVNKAVAYVTEYPADGK